MKNTSIRTKTTAILGLLVLSTEVYGAAVAVNFHAPDGRGDLDAPDAVIADFLPLDANLAGASVFDSFDAGPGTGNGSAWSNLNGVTLDGLTFTTAGGENGWNAGDDAFNDLDPILEGYLFGGGFSLTISGLNALGSGQNITLVAYGIGDNFTQDGTFTATYNTIVESSSGITYGTGGTRAAPTGTVASYTFDSAGGFVTDGVTDSLTLVAGGQFNGFSISVVPEPSAYALLTGALALGAVMVRRRRA